MIVQKVLRSLPMRFDPNISAIEEREHLGMISMYVLHGIFIAYEMRTKKKNTSKKEATFKASKKTKKKKNPESNLNCSYGDDSNEDEEISNFVRKLERNLQVEKYGSLKML
jgi:FKBP-type peptidyl-prolyl cis-trans isomerase